MFDILLLSVVVSTAYLGPMILRRFGPRQRVYGLMLVANLGLALLALISRSVEGETSTGNSIGAVAIGAGFCLIMLPPIVRDLGRRAMAADKLRAARFFADLRELLQPGMGARQESELIDTVLAVREEREDEIVDRLKARKEATDEPKLQRVLDERIVMTYLYAQRWNDAIRWYERMGGIQRPVSPQLTVEMVRAYCEDEDLESAAELVQRIEDSPLAKEPILVALVSRARLVFLAFVGRTGAVEAIVGPQGPLSKMPDAARNYWSGIARLNAGDMVGAKSSLKEAARLSVSDPRAKNVAEARLASMNEPGVMGPHSLSIEVAELADRLTSIAKDSRRDSSSETLPEAPRLSGVSLSKTPVTVLLAAANLAVSALVYWRWSSISDLGTLIANGANVKSATLNGEWWRMGSSMFLHVGVAHLALNVYGLWVLGRLVEQFHGTLRTLGIYAISGLIGALASTYFGAAGTSVGASGAVLGLMGAAVSELALYRRHYPQRWSRSLLGLLLFLAVAQVAIGFFYPIVDQWGHVGGLVGGLVVGAMLSTHARMPRILKNGLAAAAATAAIGFFAYTGYGTATTSYEDTVAAYPKVQRSVGGLLMQAPSSWEQDTVRTLYDAGVASLFDLQRLPAEIGLDAAIAARLEAERFGGALRVGFDDAKPSAYSAMPLPPGWRGAELDVSAKDGFAGTQYHRLVVFGRVSGAELWLGAYYHPKVLTPYVAESFGRMLESIVPDPAAE